MADTIHKTLTQILKDYGPHIYEDRRRLIALLKDLLARKSRSWQVKLLILSIDDGVLERLLKQLGTLPQALLLENHVRAFSESFQIYPDAARWVIESWIFCFQPYQKELMAKRSRKAFQPLVKADLKKEKPQAPALPALPKEPQVQVSPKDKTFTNALNMEFTRIDAGTFLMGSPAFEKERDSAELQHSVHISHTFYLQTTPVTQDQWIQVMGSNPSHFQGDDHPVEKVSWLQAETFITRLNTGGQFNYRLPSEAEWEYAARAGSETAYFFGNSAHQLTDYAWIKLNSEGHTMPVKQQAPNPWGLYDLYGNVREHCQDWFGPYQSEEQYDPKGPKRGTYKICRGGSWKFMPPHCRSASRHLMRPGVAVSDVGLRLVLML